MANDRSITLLERLHAAHGPVLLFASIAAMASNEPAVLAGVASAVFGLWVVLAKHLGLRPFGAANSVTSVRIALTSALGFVVPTSNLVMTALVLVVFALDGLDGWLARRRRTASHFGALYDMEGDAYLVMMTSLLLWHKGIADGWVVTAGLLRYIYAIAVRVLPIRGEAPRSRLGRYGYAILLVSFALAFSLPQTLATILAAIATAALAFSFLRSALWSFRGPPRKRSTAIVGSGRPEAAGQRL